MACCQFGGRSRGHTVLEEEAAELTAQVLLLGDNPILIRDAVFGNRRLVTNKLVTLVVIKLGVNFLELTMRQAHNASRLTAVQGDLTILTLQR